MQLLSVCKEISRLLKRPPRLSICRLYSQDEHTGVDQGLGHPSHLLISRLSRPCRVLCDRAGIFTFRHLQRDFHLLSFYAMEMPN